MDNSIKGSTNKNRHHGDNKEKKHKEKKDEGKKDEEKMKSDVKKDKINKDKDKINKDKDKINKEKNEINKEKNEIIKDKDKIKKNKDEINKDKEKKEGKADNEIRNNSKKYSEKINGNNGYDEKDNLPKKTTKNIFISSSNRTDFENKESPLEDQTTGRGKGKKGKSMMEKNNINDKDNNKKEKKFKKEEEKKEENKKEESKKEEEKKEDGKKGDKSEEKKKGKVNYKLKYKNKEKEINELEENLKHREDNIKMKISKEKSKNVKLNKEKEDFKKEKELFDNCFKQREKELNEREKKLAQKEERLKRMIEFNVPPNSPPILIGLNNIGATCYMNASLQCFSNTKKLSEYFLYDYKEDKNKKLSNEFYHVLRNLWKKENNNKPYSPTSFKEVLSKENPLFKGVAANDSKDLINFLLERFHQELGGKKINKKNKSNSKKNSIEENMGNIDQTNESQMLKFFFDDFQEKYNTPISNCFYGILETKTQCNLCKLIKFNFQIYSFLEFPLQQVNQYLASQGKKPLLTNDGKNPDIDLYECFEYNGKIDIMTGENQMYCNKCNKLNDSLFSTSIYSGPNYLIIILNRGKGAIYECKVNFPEQLNLLNYITIKTIAVVYELYAVISHLGPSSMDGHFVAYCRNRMDNKWYLYNDAIVSLCSRPQQYNDGMPYILFYKAI